MKKLISFCFASFLLTVVAFGQEASTEQVKKSCTPTKECAAKKGMTLEQCKAKCTKSSAKTASTAATDASDARLVNASMTSDKATKKCCASIEKCAAKKGMTIEECKAKCKGKTAQASTSSNTAVASAVMAKTTDAEAKTVSKKKACSSKKACCSKKKN